MYTWFHFIARGQQLCWKKIVDSISPNDQIVIRSTQREMVGKIDCAEILIQHIMFSKQWCYQNIYLFKYLFHLYNQNVKDDFLFLLTEHQNNTLTCISLPCVLFVHFYFELNNIS